jgi:uncharacterized NAD(P)/FAD-binding protein YdhS
MIELDVAIVGGGFSGCAVVSNLARYAARDLEVRLFEPGELGRGAAYGTPHPEHLLNTRAHMMSLYADDPDHFVRWLGTRAERNDFVPRRMYGEYVGETVAGALQRPGFAHVGERVVEVRPQPRSGFVLETESGARFCARTVALATGNATPNDDFLPLAMRVHPGYVGDPWRFDYGAVGGHVLIVGSGLSALDVMVALKASGHRGTVHVVSRHNRYPEIHANVENLDVIPALDTRGARALLRSFRRHVHDAAQRGFDWRAVVDALRPESEAIWRRLSRPEQLRFERHLRSKWDRHRHRMPLQVEAVHSEYRRSGRLRSYAGRVLRMESGEVTIALGDGKTVELRPNWIVNCAGLGRAAALRKDPVLGAMLAAGTISLEPSGLGLRVAWDLAAIDAAGHRVAGLWIVGSPVRGSRFEATAVPDLRGLAELAALGILEAHRLPGHQSSERISSDASCSPSWAGTV